MANPTAGIARTERYTYQSLHWGLPMAPVIVLLYALMTRTEVRPAGLVVAVVVACAVAAWAGLVVLHTGMRRAGDLEPQRWDRWWHAPARMRLHIAVWAVASLLTCGLASFLIPAVVEPGRLLDSLAFSLLAAVLAYPVFVLTRRRAPVYLTAIGLATVSLLASSDSGTFATRMAMAFPTWVWAVMLIALASMMLNVLRTTKELDRARRAGARLAVAEERLRFARDLHDVFGRTLSTVALKAELGAAQADRGRAEASATMREVQAIATGALEEMRDVVRGYRETDLATEVAGARSLLEAAGIEVTTVVEAGSLPPAVARCLAWVVREGTTNVLRHAAATSVRLTLARDAAGMTLSLVNDGAGDSPPDRGSGLTGLAERLDEVGGTLSSGARDGHWTLTARVDASALAHLDTAGSQP